MEAKFYYFLRRQTTREKSHSHTDIQENNTHGSLFMWNYLIGRRDNRSVT